jgi:Ca2+-transporting ATPase
MNHPPGAEEFPSLSATEAAARRLERGDNILVPIKRSSALRELLSTLGDPMALMLVAVAVVDYALGETRDGVIMTIALIPVLGVDALLELRSRKALAALAGAVAPRARVVRDGAVTEVPASELVDGDLLILEEGDVIAADGAVLRAANLSIDEAMLTGESLPQEKYAAPDPGVATAWAGANVGASERPQGPIVPSSATTVIAGTIVLAGSGSARIIATGARTRFAGIARLVEATVDSPTPLQRRITRIIRPLAIGAVGLAIATFALSIARGTGLRLAFITAVSLAMAAIPEEFPLVFTLFLSLGAWRLGKRGILVRRLAAVETLGSTTVLCVDKTGTLTLGKFSLDEHHALGDAGDDDLALLEAAVLACEDKPPDPLEAAIVAHAAEHGIDAAALRARWTMASDNAFDPVGKHMSHVRSSTAAAGDSRIDAKGALEGILEHCAPDPAARAAALALEAELAARGMRVLGVAGRRAPGFSGDRSKDERELVLLGLLAFRDPLRPEVPEAVADARNAGIEVKILTGDNPITASAIAAAAGLTIGEGRILTGSDLDQTPPDRLAERIRGATVLARLRPEQKHAIVASLRASGEVVAMTGDGINDAPALREADIGISMGRRATQVARAAADLVLLDDNFVALISTIREGRSIYANLQRAFLYLIGFHIPIVLLAIAMPLVGLPLLLLPVHLVWLELIVHPVSALVFESEPPGPEALRVPPRPPSAPLVERHDVVRSAAAGLVLTTSVFLAWWWALPEGMAAARTLAFAILIVGSVMLVFSERAHDRSWIAAGVPTSMRARIVLLLVIGSVPAMVYISPLANALGLEPISPARWVLAIAVGVASVGWRALLPSTRARPLVRTAGDTPPADTG